MNDNSEEESLRATIMQMRPYQLGTLSFNLGGLAWIALNLDFQHYLPLYQPGNFTISNPINLFCALVLFYAGFLACLAIKRGSLFPAFLTLTFLIALVSTILRMFWA